LHLVKSLHHPNGINTQIALERARPKTLQRPGIEFLLWERGLRILPCSKEPPYAKSVAKKGK